MTLAREEVFGPVLNVMRMDDLDAAIEQANKSAFGNGAAIFTNNGRAAREFTMRVKAGMVGVNVGILATEHVPFGGVKQSGLGREGSHHGMDDYVEIKYVCIGDVMSS